LFQYALSANNGIPRFGLAPDVLITLDEKRLGRVMEDGSAPPEAVVDQGNHCLLKLARRNPVLGWDVRTVIRTLVHKRAPLHFLVDGLQVWVTHLDIDDKVAFASRIMWLEHDFSCSPHDHITFDSGNTYKKYSSSWMSDGTVDMRVEESEGDTEKLVRLNRIFGAYQRKLDEAGVSV
jgi:hypothetical protein